MCGAVARATIGEGCRPWPVKLLTQVALCQGVIFDVKELVAVQQHVHHTGWWRSNRITLQEQTMKIASAKDLTVYKKSYALAMRIFEVTKRFPPEERYALTGQLRRSS
jgi:hypothetical protein